MLKARKQHSPDVLKGIVTFRNTDSHGWMHNTEYAQICEEARMIWLLNRGVSQKDLQARGVIIALVKAEEEFLKGAELEDEIAVTTKLEKMGKSSMTFYHEVFCNGDIAVKMRLILVCVGLAEKKSAAIPDDMRAKLAPNLPIVKQIEDARVHCSALLFQL